MDLAWLLVVPAYLLGTFPTAILVGRREGRDPTQEGSGNPGASNTFRTMGRRAGTIVLLGDVAKGALAAGVGLASGNRAVGVACGLAAVLGHVYPATRRFRGGKGVATGAGMALVLLPGVTLVLVGGPKKGDEPPKAATAPRLRLTPVVSPIGAGLVATGAF